MPPKIIAKLKNSQLFNPKPLNPQPSTLNPQLTNS